jgi:hypothetical protein
LPNICKPQVSLNINSTHSLSIAVTIVYKADIWDVIRGWGQSDHNTPIPGTCLYSRLWCDGNICPAARGILGQGEGEDNYFVMIRADSNQT